MARKILLADDSVTAQNMGRKILADAGYDVVTVNNGSAALKRITELKPDLIVLDVYMPGYSGLEVCQRLKDAAETAHIPVLLTVGKLEPFKAEEARRVRADAHIVKPFEASELLTAITRLEDRMVPQPSEGARFSASVSGVERFGGEGAGRKSEGNAQADAGWKSRLGFPSKKKKEESEPEPEDVTAGAAFRDFRKGKGKTAATPAFTVKAPAPPGQESGLVPDIPRDITPEELDALSTLAAKLDAPIPAAESIAPLADKLADKIKIKTKMGPVEAPAAESVAESMATSAAATAKTEAEVPAVAAEANKEEEKTEVEAPAPVVEPAAAAVAAPASAIEGMSEVEIPVEPVEPAAEPAVAVAGPAAGETHPHQAEHSENPETPAAVVTMDVALLAQEPAPTDKADEPMFASAASAVEPAAEDKAEQKIEGEPPEVVAKSEASAPAEAVVANCLESQPEELRAEELQAENTAQPVPVAASVPEPPEAEELSPTDEELAEALRLLTPATGRTDVSTAPSHGTLVAAGHLLAEEAARNAAAGPRWVAEPVALSPEESAISLEAEMFGIFAATPAAAPGGEMEPARITAVSAIAAAVENRLAEAEMAASAKASAGQGPERCAENKAAETSAAEAPAEAAEAMAPVSNPANPLLDGIETDKIETEQIEAEKIEPEKIETEKIEPEKIEAERKDSPAQVAEEVPEEEVAAATFADAVGWNEVEAAAEQNGEPVNGTTAAAVTAAVAEENRDSSSDVGGQEAMGKDVKAKSGKSSWHQIRTAPTGAGANGDVVEAAKQAELEAEEAPKAMAAAAAEGSSSSSAPDASTIASIVDSVMADLRPKIVEEIARKLAGK